MEEEEEKKATTHKNSNKKMENLEARCTTCRLHLRAFDLDLIKRRGDIVSE